MSIIGGSVNINDINRLNRESIKINDKLRTGQVAPEDAPAGVAIAGKISEKMSMVQTGGANAKRGGALL